MRRRWLRQLPPSSRSPRRCRVRRAPRRPRRRRARRRPHRRLDLRRAGLGRLPPAKADVERSTTDRRRRRAPGDLRRPIGRRAPRRSAQRRRGRPRIRRSGFEGCWVVALGTNDAANVAVGSASGQRPHRPDDGDHRRRPGGVGRRQDDRRDQGSYASPNMRLFNQALAKAHARYPTCGCSTGPTSSSTTGSTRRHPLHDDGYAYRAALIADALADAFPAEVGGRLTFRCRRRRGWCRSSGGCRRP